MHTIKHRSFRLLAGIAGLLAHAAAEDYVITAAKVLPAQRTTVAESGGYFPVLIRLSNGELGAALRGGATHLGANGRLDWVRSADQGKTWSKQTIADAPMDDRNPAVGQLRDGTILVTYIIDKSYAPDGTRQKELIRDGLYTVFSKDDGKTWTKPVKSGIDVQHGASPYGKILQLPNGEVLLSVYYERGPGHQHETSLLYRSRDGGRTWGDPSTIADNFNETSVIRLPDGELLAVARSHYGQYLATVFSPDQGRTWTAPVRITADHEHPADVILLHDQRLLLVFGERNRPFGVKAMLSRDYGKTWGPDRITLADDAHNSDCGYPTSVEVAPGHIVTVYYGVNESRQPDGKMAPLLEGAYARAIQWKLPE